MRTLSKVKSSAIIPLHPSVPNLIGLATIIYALRRINSSRNQENSRFGSESPSVPERHTRYLRHPPASPVDLSAVRVSLNTADPAKGLDARRVRSSFPQALRPLQEIHQRIDEHIPDNCTQEIVLRYEVGYRGTELVISLHKSRTQGILQ